MANKANKDALESVGGGDVFAPPEWKLTIVEEDPDHPKHAEHMERVRRDKPEMLALLTSLRLHGWRKAVTIAVFKDGDRWIVSEGRRRLTCLRIENKRRLEENDPRGPLRPRIVLDDDPALTTALANEMREPDPPMVRARRYVELRETMGAEKAAAAIGETLAMANALARALTLPADIQGKINRGELPVDVAARAAKKGGAAAVETIVAASTDSATGKVDGRKARAAAREMPRRAKARPARVLESVEGELRRMGGDRDEPDTAVLRGALAALSWARGTGEAPPWLAKAVESAEAVRKRKGASEEREAAE